MYPVFSPNIEFSFAFSETLEGVRSFSPSTEDIIVFVSAGPSGFPAVDVRLVLRLNSVEEENSENLTSCFFEAEEMQ